MGTIKIEVTAELLDSRLDKALSLHPDIRTRSRAEFLLDSDRVRVNGNRAKPSYRVEPGDEITVSLPEETQSVGIQPYALPLDILFEDRDLIVLNKPAGLVVHPAAGHENDTLVNALLAHTKDLSMKFGEERPGIVHRIDKETSGLLVVAKNDETHENLMQQFKDHSTHRIYEAVGLGQIHNLKGTFQSFLARHPIDRKRYSSVLGEDRKIIRHPDEAPEIGKWAVTHYETIARKGGLSYLRIQLETGRTHQIRVHLSENGIPIAGDALYGADKKIGKAESKKVREDLKSLNRFLLHAGELGFIHPRTGEKMMFKRDWPDEDLQRLKSWGLR